MRLLDTKTHELIEFTGAAVPDYAILSHTWDDEEASFVTMQDQSIPLWEVNYNKVPECCAKACADGFDYLWIDTCCIDKRSSAELSEAINSMFQWYRNSKMCYVYLSDMGSHAYIRKEDLAACRWFTRGWTLQELIASPTIQFLNSNWGVIGDKNSFHDAIKEITGILPGVLRDSANLSTANVAQKMSWAANRETTRVEDKAYSLMGLFGVNMAILYGEGERAFERLQLEIIKKGYDCSIFAWKTREGERDHYDFAGAFSGLLANSPAEFADSGKIRSYLVSSGTQPFHKTNLGIYMSLPVDPVRRDPRVLGAAELSQADPILRVYFPCYYEGTNDIDPHIAIYVQEKTRLGGVTDLVGPHFAHYARVLCNELVPTANTPSNWRQVPGSIRREVCQWPYAYFLA